MNAACEIASTYLNNTQSVCHQTTTGEIKKTILRFQAVLIAGGISFSVTLLHFFFQAFRVVGIYVNKKKCFNFTHKMCTAPKLLARWLVDLFTIIYC